jgi:hypothetical protein
MKRKALVLGGVVLLAIAVALCSPGRSMATRDIGCANTSGRGYEICTALSRSMEWTWMGHAVLWPGFRPTWRGLASVWCTQRIADGDVPVLETLRRASSDWRLESGADSLIRIAKNRTGSGDEPENSIFNPRNPEYILKGGCGTL